MNSPEIEQKRVQFFELYDRAEDILCDLKRLFCEAFPDGSKVKYGAYVEEVEFTVGSDEVKLELGTKHERHRSTHWIGVNCIERPGAAECE